MDLLKENREKAYFTVKMAELPGTQVRPWTTADFAHFPDATSSLSAKFWKHFHPNPGIR